MQLGSGEFKVDVNKYWVEEKSNKSLLILPPTGGVTVLDRSFARKFARAGYDVYVVETWTGLGFETVNLDMHNTTYGAGQRAIQAVLAQIDTDFIGILGTSVGALHAIIAASQEAKVDAVFAIVGGTPQSEIIVKSKVQQMVALRQKRFAHYKFTNDSEYQKALDDIFKLEPLKLEPLFKGKKLGMVLAKSDDKVPTSTQEQLRELWSPSLLIEYDGGHFSTIIKTWFFEDDKILEFFESASLKK